MTGGVTEIEHDLDHVAAEAAGRPTIHGGRRHLDLVAGNHRHVRLLLRHRFRKRRLETGEGIRRDRRVATSRTVTEIDIAGTS